MSEAVHLQRQLLVFRDHYAKILNAVSDHEMFGAELFSKGLVSLLEFKNARSQSCFTSSMCDLLDYIHAGLSMGTVSFDSFLDVLENLEPQTQCIVKTIKESLAKTDDRYPMTRDPPAPIKSRLKPAISLQMPPSKRICRLPSILDHFTNEEDIEPSSTTDDPVIEELDSSGEVVIGKNPLSVQSLLEEDEDSEENSGSIDSIPQSLSLLQPTGSLSRKVHARVYNKLFKMAWNGEDQQAMSFVRTLRKNSSVSIDLKVICMEVVHTVNSQRDLKMLLSALACTDRAECENKTILKCRLHRRIAGLHYRNGDLEDANEHLVTATQLAEHLSPDIDTVYTLRLNALMLFEQYKENKDDKSRKGAEKYFQMAMDHVKRLPDSKRLITERIKVSKALFHLDMMKLYSDDSKSEEAIEQLEYRAQDTLEDIDETYLTDGDRAFFYSTRAQLKLCNQSELDKAEEYAKKAIDLSNQCGLKESLANKNGTTVLEEIKQLRKPTI